MTGPALTCQSSSPDPEALFSAAAAEYDHYRTGVPAQTAALLNPRVRRETAPCLLDLSTGSGQVPRAVLHTLPRLAHIDAPHARGATLERARDALTLPLRSANTDPELMERGRRTLARLRANDAHPAEYPASGGTL